MIKILVMALRQLSENIPRISQKVFSRKYIALGRVVTCWPQIVGADMASRAQPVKIHYRRRKGKNANTPDASLEVAVTSADAAVLQYQTGVLIEKMERLFGERWITDIRFTHVPANRQPVTAAPGKTLTEEQKSHLSLMLGDGDDQDIKEKLYALGESVLLKNT
jgi:hypothetical protein